MDSQKVYYEVQLPLAGRPGEWFVVCRAVAPENAAAVVRALLDTRDRDMGEVHIKVCVQVGPVEW